TRLPALPSAVSVQPGQTLCGPWRLSRSYSTDEETDDDSEPEPPPVARRKVSFADAFGLDLVSVKEFDNIDLSESEVVQCNDRERKHSLEEFYMSCLFSVPSSQAELHERLHTQMVELESIELLPGTTTLRGKIRVVNLCYNKLVYARITLDRWNSYFDLLAEYVPGSSDRETDRFTFSYTLVPPFERDGTRVEFCLRYETSLGTFWANNKEMNYLSGEYNATFSNRPLMKEVTFSSYINNKCRIFNKIQGFILQKEATIKAFSYNRLPEMKSEQLRAQAPYIHCGRGDVEI
uniref:CBM21 domain-containing protein n=1 Tax=Gouania willdenowi TaxID=441366 RepID=A0A8C5GRR4_GOUWI